MTDQTLLALLLGLPLLAAAVAFVLPVHHWREWLSAGGAGLVAIVALITTARVANGGTINAFDGYLRVDALSALMLATVALLGFSATLASIPYIRHDREIGHLPNGEGSQRWYFAGILGFTWTMLFTVTVNNVGLLWVGIEATTLVSALLVGFYRTRAGLEAAWKYLVLCTVGITCALFGVLLTYYAAQQGSETVSMNWSRLSQVAPGFDPAIMRLAFVFILIGFGTKAGLAPMHTWLADAHSQAPSPVSGLLSGVLLACALYGILRFQSLTNASTGTAFASHLLLVFGVLSVLIAAPFILVQRDLKRLFAYSSVEHVGLMAVAFGIGGPIGITAGLLHLMNHAATKGMVFLVSGEIGQTYGNRRISAIHNILRVTPFAGWLLIAGVLALTGAPPFGIFTSELLIFNAGFSASAVEMLAVLIVVLALVVIFAGMVFHAIRLSRGPDPGGPANQPASVAPGGNRNLILAAAVLPLLVVMVLFGLHVPGVIRNLLNEASKALEPFASRSNVS